MLLEIVKKFKIMADLDVERNLLKNLSNFPVTLKLFVFLKS